jgi:chorismate mutase
VKQKNRDQIVDQVRINKIIEKLKKEGDKRGLPGNLVEKLWLTMIQEFILYEEKIFDEVHKKN